MEPHGKGRDDSVFGPDRPEALEFDEDDVRRDPNLVVEREVTERYRNSLTRGIHTLLDETITLMEDTERCQVAHRDEGGMRFTDYIYMGNEPYESLDDDAEEAPRGKLITVATVTKADDQPVYRVSYQVIGPTVPDEDQINLRQALAKTFYSIYFDDEETRFDHDSTLVSVPSTRRQPSAKTADERELTEEEEVLFDEAAMTIEPDSIYALRQFRDFLIWLKETTQRDR
jgi:hypothetical protein